jgi:reverse gyrase
MDTEERKDLRAGGWAPGYYLIAKCAGCGKEFMGDKRAWRCEVCAELWIEDRPYREFKAFDPCI